MAKQHFSYITGTIENLTFYKLQDSYYVRAKSSLTGKRVKSDPTFSKTMANAQKLGIASKVASHYYRKLPKEEQQYQLFCSLRSIGIRALREDCSEEGLHDLIVKEIRQRGLTFLSEKIEHVATELNKVEQAEKAEETMQPQAKPVVIQQVLKPKVALASPKVFTLPSIKRQRKARHIRRKQRWLGKKRDLHQAEAFP